MSEKVSDPRVGRALLLMEQNLAQPLSIAHVTEKLSLSTRQFERLCHATLGKSPAMAYRHLRLRYARWLIDHTDRSVTDIATNPASPTARISLASSRRPGAPRQACPR